jgi:hypothetical protein
VPASRWLTAADSVFVIQACFCIHNMQSFQSAPAILLRLEQKCDVILSLPRFEHVDVVLLLPRLEAKCGCSTTDTQDSNIRVKLFFPLCRIHGFLEENLFVLHLTALNIAVMLRVDF